MLKTPEKISAGRASGFSLVELMISITIGLVVLGGVVSIFVSSVKSNADALKMTRLNQELQAVMSMMTRDIRRAGYWGTATNAIGSLLVSGVETRPNTNPFDNPATFTRVATGKYGSEAANSCITFSYDTDADGNIDVGSGAAPTNGTDERFGFRLNSRALETRESGALCTDDGWQNITDERSTRITTLQFTLKPQPAISLNNPDLKGKCEGADTYNCTINVREVQIELKGELVSDVNVKRELTETVRIRNDLWNR